MQVVGGRRGNARLQETAQSMLPDAQLWINVSLVLRPGPGNLPVSVWVAAGIAVSVAHPGYIGLRRYAAPPSRLWRPTRGRAARGLVVTGLTPDCAELPWLLCACAWIVAVFRSRVPFSNVRVGKLVNWLSVWGCHCARSNAADYCVCFVVIIASSARWTSRIFYLSTAWQKKRRVLSMVCNLCLSSTLPYFRQSSKYMSHYVQCTHWETNGKFRFVYIGRRIGRVLRDGGGSLWGLRSSVNKGRKFLANTAS